MASAMFESLVKNHPFVDGNKRVVFFATDIFLRMNGYKFQVEAKMAHAFLMNLIDTNTCDLEHLHSWVINSVTKI